MNSDWTGHCRHITLSMLPIELSHLQTARVRATLTQDIRTTPANGKHTPVHCIQLFFVVHRTWPLRWLQVTLVTSSVSKSIVPTMLKDLKSEQASLALGCLQIRKLTPPTLLHCLKALKKLHLCHLTSYVLKLQRKCREALKRKCFQACIQSTFRLCTDRVAGLQNIPVQLHLRQVVVLRTGITGFS